MMLATEDRNMPPRNKFLSLPCFVHWTKHGSTHFIDQWMANGKRAMAMDSAKLSLGSINANHVVFHFA